MSGLSSHPVHPTVMGSSRAASEPLHRFRFALISQPVDESSSVSVGRQRKEYLSLLSVPFIDAPVRGGVTAAFQTLCSFGPCNQSGPSVAFVANSANAIQSMGHGSGDRERSCQSDHHFRRKRQDMRSILTGDCDELRSVGSKRKEGCRRSTIAGLLRTKRPSLTGSWTIGVNRQWRVKRRLRHHH